MRRPDSCAFFLASTLLETLTEHFQDAELANPATAEVFLSHAPEIEEKRSVLLLDNALDWGFDSASASRPEHAVGPDVVMAPQVYDLTRQGCSLPGDPQLIHQLFAKVAFRVLSGPPTGLDKPHRLRDWIAAGHLGRSPSPSESVVLTSDGSFRASTSASGWGIVVSLRDSKQLSGDGQLSLYGSMAPLSHFIGHTQPPDAYDAEVAGLLWCAVVLSQLLRRGGAVVRADSTSALSGVAGSSQMRTSALCLAARSLHASVGVSLSGSVRYEYVRGHMGEPSNELADALAAYGASERSSVSPFWFDVHAFLCDGAIMAQWLPHFAMSIQRSSELPTLYGGTLTWDATPGSPVHPPGFSMRPFLRAFPEEPLQTELSKNKAM